MLTAYALFGAIVRRSERVTKLRSKSEKHFLYTSRLAGPGIRALNGQSQVCLFVDSTLY